MLDASASKRAATIMFSEKAVIQRIGPDLCFLFEVFDARANKAMNVAGRDHGFHGEATPFACMKKYARKEKSK